MDPVTPVTPFSLPDGWTDVIYAKDQPQYRPLRVLQGPLPEQRVISVWKPDAEELARLVAGEGVVLTLLTFGGPLQPILLGVSPLRQVGDEIVAGRNCPQEE